MAINFPDSPSVGDTHSDGGAVWKWNGYAWRRVPDPGAKGEPGQKGEKGQKGEVGLTGAQGDKGVKGEPSTVAGAKGQKGEDGQKGSTGAGGDKGAKGEPSTVAGDKGDKGDKGGTGAGTKGEKGAGSSVTIGVSPPTSPTPVAGDMWWDSDDADLHVYYNDGNSAQWVSVTSSAALKGQTGDKGQKGDKGEVGQKGDTGDKGQKGEVGATGGTGGTGQKGQKGQDGNDATGTKGQKGEKGEIGPQGGSGGTGAKGEPGSGGSDGSDGDKGQKGAPGSSGSTGIPSGFIGLWSGAANNIPSGWYLCDGNNGTPNLKDRFVIGAGNSYAVNATGGSKDATLVSHSHSVSGSTGNDSHNHGITDPGHSHTMSARWHNSVNSGGALSFKDVANSNQIQSNTTGISINSDTHNHSISGSTNSQGSSATNANLPPYYALCYIMKA